MLRLYIVIQTCKGYEKSINNLLNQLNELNFNKNIIIVENKNDFEEVIQNDITYIKTIKNNFEMTMFAKIYEHIESFSDNNLFLFLHDTIELHESFKEKIFNLVEILNKEEFDYAPLSKNFQSCQGFAKTKFIKEKFGVFSEIDSVTKEEAIDWEWGKGKYANINLSKLSQNTKFIGEMPILIDSNTSFLDSTYKRTKIFFDSIGIYKYYFIHSNNSLHPNKI